VSKHLFIGIVEFAPLVLSRPKGRGIDPILAPRLGNAQAFGLAFRSLYVANKKRVDF